MNESVLAGSIRATGRVRESGGAWLSQTAGLAGFAVLFLLILWPSASRLGVYDEPYYLRYAELIDRFGLSKEFLNHLPGSPGPLVALTQYAFKPLTQFTMPGMRLVNAFLLVLMTLILHRIFKLRRAEHAWASSLAILAVPAAWVMGGLAMSEMPALVFVTLSLLFLMLWVEAEGEERRRIPLYALAGGLCLGIGGLGRQTFLSLMGAPALYAVVYRKHILPAAIFCAAALIPVAPVFLIWGSIMPPSPLRVQSGLSPVHALLSLGYLGAFFLILAPEWFYRKALPIAGIFVATVAANWYGGFLNVAPTLYAQSYLKGFWLEAYKQSVSGTLLALGVVFLVSFGVRLAERRHDSRFFLLATGLFLLGLVPITVSNNYSNRYTACALPLILLVSDEYGPATRAKAARLAIGMSLGVAYLCSYLLGPAGWELPWSSVIP